MDGHEQRNSADDFEELFERGNSRSCTTQWNANARRGWLASCPGWGHHSGRSPACDEGPIVGRQHGAETSGAHSRGSGAACGEFSCPRFSIKRCKPTGRLPKAKLKPGAVRKLSATWKLADCVRFGWRRVRRSTEPARQKSRRAKQKPKQRPTELQPNSNLP